MGFIVSVNTVAAGKRPAITAKMRCTSACVRYMVRPSMMTSAGPDGPSTAAPQSSMADIASCEMPLSGRSASRTAMVSGRSRLYQWA